MKFSYIAFFLSFLLVSCGGNGDDRYSKDNFSTETGQAESDYPVSEPGTTPEVSNAIADAFDRILDDYLQLSGALVATDLVTAVTYAKKLSESANLFRQIESDDVMLAERDNWGAEILSYSTSIAGESDVEVQRKFFEELSLTMISIVEQIGHQKEKLFHQRCPMVNGGNGDWLSMEEQILNPYHGNRMLNCGTTVRTM